MGGCILSHLQRYYSSNLEKAGDSVQKLQEWVSNKQEKFITRVNRFLQDLSIARIIKTLLVLKVALFLTWLLPGWFFFFVLIEAWAFKEEIQPYRQQLKEQAKGLGKTVEHRVS